MIFNGNNGNENFSLLSQVQASQFAEFLKPIPKTGLTGWKVTKTVVGIHESRELCFSNIIDPFLFFFGCAP